MSIVGKLSASQRFDGKGKLSLWAGLPSLFLKILILCLLSNVHVLQAQRLHEKKEHSTQEQALDPKTKLMLFKLVDSGVLAEVNGCISTGKEACVYHAVGGK